MNASKFWAAVRNAALKVVAFWVLILAAYLALGRQFFPYIDRLEPEIEIWLSQQLGTQVDIGQLEGEWVRFNPVVHLTNVTLGNELTIAAMTLAPGIYESIARGGPSFIRFEVTDFKAELEQFESGWKFTGLNSDNDSSSSIDVSSVLQLIQRQQKVQFSNTHLSIKPKDLPAFELNLQQGTLGGYGLENGLLANATLHANQVEIPIELQIETTQDALGLNRIYFSHGEINLTPWLKSLNANISNATIAGEYWLNLQGEHWQSATSRIQASSLIIDGPFADIELTDAQFEGYVEARTNGFESWLNLINYSLNGEPQPQAQAKLSRRANRIKLQWDTLPASMVGAWFAMTDANDFWRGISPAGTVDQGSLSLLDGDPESLIISAQVNDLSLQAHQAVPALNNLQGTLRMEGNSGELAMSSANSNFHLANLYSRSFNTEILNTTLRWDVQPKLGLQAEGYAQMNLLPFADNQPKLPIELAWYSKTPNSSEKAQGREPVVELHMTLPEMDRSWFVALADNSQLDPNVAAYLDSRLEAGQFANLELNYLTSRDLQNKNDSQFFLNADFSQAEFSFLDDWYSLIDLSGRLSVDNTGLIVESQSGQYPGFNIANAKMKLPFQSLELNAQFEANTTAEETLFFLTSGPLREQIGDTLDSWLADGKVQAKGRLNVPLKSPNDFTVEIAALVNEVDLNLQNIDMQFSDVQGVLNYSTVRGLFADKLTLQHEGRAQTLTLDSRLNTPTPTLNLYAQGTTPVQYWGERFDDVFLQQQRVDIKHTTSIEVTANEVAIDSISDLVGLELDFPEPLNKPAEQAMAMRMLVHIDERSAKRIETSLDNRLFSEFALTGRNEIVKGLVSYGQPLVDHEEAGVFFDFKVSEVDGDAWWQSIQNLRSLYTQQPVNEQTNSPSFESLIRAIHIESDSVSYFAQPWQHADVSLFRNQDAWILNFETEEGVGQVLVPHQDEPIFADINWVSITTGEEDIPFEQAVDPLSDYLPTDVPNMQLQISKLQWNGKDLGAWRAELASLDNQLNVTNIVGEMAGAAMKGELHWQVIEEKHSTQFDGQIQLANVLDVLNTWQYAPVLTSRSGVVDIQSAWQGSPAHFDFKRMQGAIELSLEKGSILEVDEFEGIKLIGLLNFTRVLNRIALDFSDLIREGITYDSIEGELLFDRGFARVGKQLVIDGSATKFQFSGDADLISDALDVDMVLTVPLSSTFPLVALLAGVTPQAAAAIYVTERVFNDELERLSSARMHITGSFEEPDTKFYRVFEGAGKPAVESTLP